MKFPSHKPSTSRTGLPTVVCLSCHSPYSQGYWGTARRTAYARSGDTLTVPVPRVAATNRSDRLDMSRKEVGSLSYPKRGVHSRNHAWPFLSITALMSYNPGGASCSRKMVARFSQPNDSAAFENGVNHTALREQ